MPPTVYSSRGSPRPLMMAGRELAGYLGNGQGGCVASKRGNGVRRRCRWAVSRVRGVEEGKRRGIFYFCVQSAAASAFYGMRDQQPSCMLAATCWSRGAKHYVRMATCGVTLWRSKPTSILTRSIVTSKEGVYDVATSHVYDRYRGVDD